MFQNLAWANQEHLAALRKMLNEAHVTPMDTLDLAARIFIALVSHEVELEIARRASNDEQK